MSRVHGLNNGTKLLHEELQRAFVLLNIICDLQCNLQKIVEGYNTGKNRIAQIK